MELTKLNAATGLSSNGIDQVEDISNGIDRVKQREGMESIEPDTVEGLSINGVN
jgi:hypothetical protein